MNLNFNEICRLCLRICEEYVDLNEANGVKTLTDDLVEKIKYCYVIQIDLSEGFPTKICYECIQVLSFFHTAKKNVVICEKLLRDVFVKRKLQEGTKSHEDENMRVPDVEITQDEGKTKLDVVTENNKQKESDHLSVKVIDIELKCNRKQIYTSGNSASPVVNIEKEVTSSDDKACISVLEEHNSKLMRKKKLEQLRYSGECSDSTQNDRGSDMEKLPSTPRSNLQILLKFRDLKKAQCHRRRISKSVKDKVPKLLLGISPPLKEHAVKEIGTVIDTSNILSPNVKRTRRSILAR